MILLYITEGNFSLKNIYMITVILPCNTYSSIIICIVYNDNKKLRRS
jgi:hypothetical protein